MKLLLRCFLFLSAFPAIGQQEENYYCTDWDYRLIPYRKGDCWGYADPKGNIVVQPRYEQAGLLRLGRARIRLNGQYGYLNRFGNMAVAPQYDAAGEFVNGKAKVSLNGKTLVIDKSGKVLDNPLRPGVKCGGVIMTIHYFDQCLIDGKITLLTNRCCVFDSIQNKRVVRYDTLPGKFDAVQENGKGLAAVRIGTKWGMVDQAGRMILAPEYDEITFKPHPRGSETQYYGKVRQDNCWGMADHRGKLIIPPKYASISEFDQGVVWVENFDKPGGYVDRQGMEFFED